MWEIEDQFHVRIGGNTYINVPNIVVYKDTPLFSLRRHVENDYLGIDFEIFDKDGNHVATVKRNEIYRGDKDAYKIEGSLNRYVLSEQSTGRVICDIKKREDARPAELDVSVELYTPSGFLFNATPEQTNLGTNTFKGNTIVNCQVGIMIT